jgi:hypothetical protein
MPRQAEIGFHLDAPGPVEFHAELLRQRGCRNARRPQDVAGADDFTVRQLDFAGADVFHVDVIPDLHAERLKLALRAGGQIRREMGKHQRRTFDQDDARFGGINPPEIPVQHRARQFGECARQFHAGRSAAHHHDRHQTLAFGGIGFVFRLLEGEQDLAADAQGVVEGFEAGRELFPLGMTEVTGLAPQREHEIIIIQRRPSPA